MEILQDSIMQSFIFSPLMGVFFAAIFTGFTSSPSLYTPTTVIETKRVYIDRRTQYISNRSKNSDGNEGMALVFILLFLVFAYVKNVPIIHHYLAMSWAVLFSFCATGLLVSFTKGHFTSIEWLRRVLIPMSTLMSCLMLLIVAKEGISSGLIEIANTTNMWQFFTKELTEYGRYYLVFHVTGILCLMLLLLCSTATIVHYLALMNQREYGYFHDIWVWLTAITSRLSGERTGVALMIGGVVSYLLLSGKIAAWIVFGMVNNI